VGCRLLSENLRQTLARLIDTALSEPRSQDVQMLLNVLGWRSSFVPCRCRTGDRAAAPGSLVSKATSTYARMGFKAQSQVRFSRHTPHGF